MNINAFLIVTTVLLGALGIIWGSNKRVDQFVKIVLIGMAIWGLLVTLNVYGYIVKL